MTLGRGLRLVALSAALLMAGCQSTPKAGSSDYRELYERRQYADAYRAAMEAQTQGSSVQREQAALIAGLSAAALNRNDEADRILRPLLQSNDATVSGKAAAQLGLIAYERDRHAEASDLLGTASSKLQGDEGARASLYAGDALRAQGRTAEARSMYERAQSQVEQDSAIRVLASDRLAAVSGTQATGGGNFTVQMGAFSSFQRAQVQADRFRARAQAAGLPTPRIVQTRNQAGVTVFAVRVGRFQTRQQAEAARANLGPDARIMTATGE